jgi:hypothetical protein
MVNITDWLIHNSLLTIHSKNIQYMNTRTIKLLLAITVTGTVISGCYKKFDPKTYAPALEIAGYTSSSEISPSNLIAYWPFDGDLIDKVGAANGTNTGTTFGVGYKGQALQGALNSYVLAEPSNNIKNMHSFTITYWMNSGDATNGIIGTVNLAKTDGFWGNIDMFIENVDVNNNIRNRFRVHVQDGPNEFWVSKDNITGLTGAWTAIAVSYDEATTTYKFYVNGSLIVTGTAPAVGALGFTNIGKLVFGAVHFQTNPSQTSATGSQGWASYLTGRLDEVRIYNKALTDSDVNALVLLEGRGK